MPERAHAARMTPTGELRKRERQAQQTVKAQLAEAPAWEQRSGWEGMSTKSSPRREDEAVGQGRRRDGSGLQARRRAARGPARVGSRPQRPGTRRRRGPMLVVRFATLRTGKDVRGAIQLYSCKM